MPYLLTIITPAQSRLTHSRNSTDVCGMKAWMKPQNVQDKAKKDISYTVEHKLGAELLPRGKLSVTLSKSHLLRQRASGLEI